MICRAKKNCMMKPKLSFLGYFLRWLHQVIFIIITLDKLKQDNDRQLVQYTQ